MCPSAKVLGKHDSAKGVHTLPVRQVFGILACLPPCFCAL